MPKFILYISITCLLVFLGLGCEEIDPTQLEPPLASGISLELSWGSINFQEDIYEYNLTVPDNFTSLDITPTYNEELKMRINNQLVESGETSEKLYLQYGVENIINLDLIRENSWDSHYVIKIRSKKNCHKMKKVDYQK